jgi:hypothetical protein
MQRFIRALGSAALISTLAACVVAPPQTRVTVPAPVVVTAPAPGPVVVVPPRPVVVVPAPIPRDDAAIERFAQINVRIDNLNRDIERHVNAGYYPPPEGGALHHRLEVIRQEARDMAAAHGGGISHDEQHVLNEELNTAARAIKS